MPSVCAWCGQPAECPECDGEGRRMGEECHLCGGDGVQLKLVDPGLIRKGKDGPVVIDYPRRVPACDEHCAIPEVEEPAVVRARKAAEAKKWKHRQERMC